jgi:hypothetical protein
MGKSDGIPTNALPAGMVKSGQNPSENSMQGQAMSCHTASGLSTRDSSAVVQLH